MSHSTQTWSLYKCQTFLAAKTPKKFGPGLTLPLWILTVPGVGQNSSSFCCFLQVASSCLLAGNFSVVLCPRSSIWCQLILLLSSSLWSSRAGPAPKVATLSVPPMVHIHTEWCHTPTKRPIECVIFHNLLHWSVSHLKPRPVAPFLSLSLGYF